MGLQTFQLGETSLEVSVDEVKLSMEQEFHARLFKSQCQSLTREQAVELLGDLYRQMLVKEAIYKSFLLREIGLSLPTLGESHE